MALMVDEWNALTGALDVHGRATGALAGKAFVVKENIDVAGCLSMNGNPAFAASHAAAAAHAPAVDRLFAAGARLVGKAHMDEMAYSLLGANPHYGTPRNPAAPTRHPGGSSSGAAVAVAARLADFALGTDTAGSCRAPAAFCGVYGFRPSHGAVSSNGVIPLAPSLDTIGWFARDIETMIDVGDVLLPRDLDEEPGEAIAYLRDGFTVADPAFADAARAALDRLAKHGRLNECALGDDFFTQALTHFRNFQAFEAWQSQGAWIKATQPDFGPGVAERFAYAATVTIEQKERADAFRQEWREKIESLLVSNGPFLVPTTPFPAPLLDESAEALDTMRYKMMRIFLIASYFGLPQISVPLNTQGAPLALSLIGRRWSDRSLLELARRLAPG
jgi:amidase